MKDYIILFRESKCNNNAVTLYLLYVHMSALLSLRLLFPLHRADNPQCTSVILAHGQSEAGGQTTEPGWVQSEDIVAMW